jgi:DNA-binding transcriptional MerR regulator
MGYTIAQAAKLTRLSPYTLRYYDREGLLPSVLRDKSGNRVFTDADIENLRVICCLKNTGMPLKQIKEFTDWQHAGDGTLRDRRAMLRRHRQAVLDRIDELRQNLEAIDKKLAYYEQACAAYDAGRPVPPCGCGPGERD